MHPVSKFWLSYQGPVLGSRALAYGEDGGAYPLPLQCKSAQICSRYAAFSSYRLYMLSGDVLEVAQFLQDGSALAMFWPGIEGDLFCSFSSWLQQVIPALS